MSDKALTLPALFRKTVARLGDRVARRRKRGGQWIGQTWNEFARSVDEIARGLVAAGVAPKQRAAILSSTRAEWVECDLGILSAGAVTVPIYPSSLPKDIEYILNNAEVVLVFCENEDQAKKVAAIRASCPTLKRVVVMEGASSPSVATLDELKKEGWQVASDEVTRRVAAGDPDEVATIVYTSGTTGPPKGVVQTHANHYWMVHNIAGYGDMTEHDEDLIFLPLAHSFARCEEYAQIYIGFTTSYAESLEKIVDNCGEVKPTVLFSVPRIYEKFYEKVMAGLATAAPRKRRIAEWAIGIGRRMSQKKQAGEAPGFLLELKWKVADRLVLHKIRERMGGRIRFCVTGAAPIARNILEFFHGAGIQILEGYGLTETTPALTLNRLAAYRFGSVGKAIPGCELKIAEDGEILGRGPNIAKGYYKREEETRAVFLPDGWFATGDIGVIDADGFLKITDRKKDLIKTSGGKYVAPQEVEHQLKSDPLIAQAMVHGDRRKYCSAILVLNRETVEAWAKREGIATDGYESLVKHAKLRELVQALLDEKNKKLASYEQVKKFIIAPKEWTPESGELTPTLKVKRKVVTAKFEKELDALYEEKYA
ncbi:MAG TPA: long-chain fatty acid--CoA ligase [Planctomycetota bacterium]|nr:long-chain fatty acid--CoA ligase [Planctomycetota bacterium]